MSFKNTSNLANGLTKDRASIQNEFSKLAGVKAQLEELKNQKKTKEPILTSDERASAINEAEIKGTGFIMDMTQSEKGRNMIED